MESNLTNGTSAGKPIEVSFPLPRAGQTKIHLRLTINATNLLLFLTTSTGEAATTAPLGSFVYSMPNRANPSEPFSTPLYTHSSTLDFTTRISKVLARKTNRPVYVGNSISFANAGMGGTVEEEMDGFRRCVEVVVGLMERELEIGG